MIDWVPVAAAALGVLLVSFFVTFLFVRRARKAEKKATLFGSTVKTAKPGAYNSVTVGIQPAASSLPSSPVRRGDGSYAALSDDHLRTEGERAGLSGLHARWRSQDADNADEMGSASECGSTITLSSPTPPATSWKLWLKLAYNTESQSLAVTIFRAKATVSGALLPESYETTVYVAAMLLPEQTMQQTATYPNTGSPSFDETLSFLMSPEALSSGTLRLSLYELNWERTRICLGHAVIRLDNVPDLLEGGSHYLDASLEPLVTAMEGPSGPAPQLRVSLSYNTTKEKLKVAVMGGRNLPPPSESGEDYSYHLRTQVILGTRSVKVKRSAPSANIEEIFNVSYAFQVPAKHMDQCCVQLSVIRTMLDGQARRLGEELWGEAAMGPCIYAHGTGLHHWKTMLQNTRKSVEMWHRLVQPEKGQATL